MHYLHSLGVYSVQSYSNYWGQHVSNFYCMDDYGNLIFCSYNSQFSFELSSRAEFIYSDWMYNQ